MKFRRRHKMLLNGRLYSATLEHTIFDDNNTNNWMHLWIGPFGIHACWSRNSIWIRPDFGI